MKSSIVLAAVASLSCITVAVACSSSSGHSFGNGGDSGTDASTDGTAGDSGSSSGGPTYAGTMGVAETAAGLFTIAGEFFAAPDASATPNMCPGQGTMSGSCCYEPPLIASDAGASDAGVAEAGASPFVSAGTIALTDGTSALANMSPGSNGAYGISSSDNPSVKWTPGDTLAIAASGAVIDAFTGNLVTVTDFAGLVPALSLKTATTVPLADPLVISWTASTATTVRLLMIAAKSGAISCSVADSAGTLTVPTALLSKLTTNDTGLISLTRQLVTPATVTNATVQLVSTSTTTGTAKFQ